MTATLLKRHGGGSTAATRRVGKARRHFRVRKNVFGTTERPRLVVSRSLRSGHRAATAVRGLARFLGLK